MLFDSSLLRYRRAVQFALLLCLLALRRAFGAEPPAGVEREAQAAGNPHSAVYTLIDRLSERGVLTKDDRTELLLAAEADEADMRAQTAEVEAAKAEAAAARARLRAVMAQVNNRRGGSGASQPAAIPAPAPIAPPAAAPSAALPAPAEPSYAEPPRRQAPAVRESEPPATYAADPAPPPRRVTPRYEAPPAPTEMVPPPARSVARAATQPLAESVDNAIPAPAPESFQAPPARVQGGRSRREAVDAEVSAAPAAMENQAPVRVARAESTSPAQAAVDDQPSIAMAPSVPESQLPPNTVRVSYVPEAVKEEIRDEVKQDLVEQGAKEGWATPGSVPDWINRFRLYADLRMRYDGISFPGGNLPADTAQLGSSYWNYNAINTGAPYDVYSTTNINNPPFPDRDQGRNRVRLRARLGTTVDFAEGVSAGLRFATGESNSPVSENQTLGAAGGGQGGNFSRYALWLDRAYLKWESGGLPNQDLTVTLGRFDNPFFATSMIWADDLAFDGLAIQGKFPAGENITPFFTLGAFPVFNTDFNFATNQPAKYKSYDKWLAAAQLGAHFDLGKSFELKLGSAYYLFKNIEGRVSDPMAPLYATDVGNTDASRPAFAQTGNTYIALRDIIPLSSGQLGPQFQYFGLATPFHELAVTGQLDFNKFEPFQVSLLGEYVKNLAFDREAILKNGPPQQIGPVNNNAADGTTFGGGSTGWITSLRLGRLGLKQRWDWNVGIGYRRVQSDSVVDGFADSDFGGGGTNFKGYTLTANLAVFTDVWLGLRYMSATSIAGPAIKNDIIQFDVNSRF